MKLQKTNPQEKPGQQPGLGTVVIPHEEKEQKFPPAGSGLFSSLLIGHR